MKVVGLISGGKDSFYNLMQCVANGHQVVALGNLHPRPEDNKDEIDSYMYQTVGHDAIHLYQECMNVPLYRQSIQGSAISQGSDYTHTPSDETEDLLTLLQTVKSHHPDIEAVSVGAILSNYQRVRVENVCARLGLISLSYLWQRNQKELLKEMADAGVNAVLVKVAAMGLKVYHLGRSIGDMYLELVKMNEQFDVHICGEGGEFETLTLDCPLFETKRITVVESEVVIHSDDAFAQVAYLKFKQLAVVDKDEDEIRETEGWMDRVNKNPVWETVDEDTKIIEDIVESRLKDAQEVKALSVVGQGVLPKRRAMLSPAKKCLIHEGKVVCAVGATTAYDFTNHSNGKIPEFESIAEETLACMSAVGKKLAGMNLTWADVVFMNVFVSDMTDFAKVNGAYKTFFGINPAPRACVAANLPKPSRIQISCSAIRSSPTRQRKTMHVQGMSYWAPANIGPYSQCTVSEHHAFVAGQIGMIPSTLGLPSPPSLAQEISWSLRNLRQITLVENCDLAQRTALCVAFVNDPKSFGAVQAAWDVVSLQKIRPPFLMVCLPALPKFSMVEWQVLMHYGKVYGEKKKKASKMTRSSSGKVKRNSVGGLFKRFSQQSRSSRKSHQSEGEDEDEKSDNGNDTDDDTEYELSKRELKPVQLQLLHKFEGSSAVLAWPGVLQETNDDNGSAVAGNGVDDSAIWLTSTESWFLAPLLSIVSVACAPIPSLLDALSALSFAAATTPLTPELEAERKAKKSKEIEKRQAEWREAFLASKPGQLLKTTINMMIKAIDRILEKHSTTALEQSQPQGGPGVEGWSSVVSMTVYFDEALFGAHLEELRMLYEQEIEVMMKADGGGSSSSNNSLALTFVPVLAMGNNGVLAATVHAVGEAPKVPGLYQ